MTEKTNTLPQALERYLADQAAGKRHLGVINYEGAQDINFDMSGGVILGARSSFARSIIESLNLSGAEAPELSLEDASAENGEVLLSRAQIPRAILKGFRGRVVFRDTIGPGMDARGAHFVNSYFGGDLSGSNAEGAVFEGCQLRADFSNSEMVGIHFVNAPELRGNFQNANLFGVDFSKIGEGGKPQRALQALLHGANLDETNWTGQMLGKLQFSPQTTMRRAILRRCNARGLDLSGIDMTGADLRGADLQGADLTGATWVDVKLDLDTKLAGAIGLASVKHNLPELTMALRLIAWFGLDGATLSARP